MNKAEEMRENTRPAKQVHHLGWAPAPCSGQGDSEGRLLLGGLSPLLLVLGRSS